MSLTRPHRKGVKMVIDKHQVIEKRDSLRICFEAKVLIGLSPDYKSVILGAVENVSYGGLRVKHLETHGDPLRRLAKVDFEILVDYFNLRGKGEIAWISPNREMLGIKFKQFNKENRNSLEKFIASRMTGSPLPPNVIR